MLMEHIVPSLRIVVITKMGDHDIMEEFLEKLLALDEDHFLVGFHQ